MEHYLKIGRSFADAVCDGRKTFELRRNDRGYNAGDTIRFHCVEQSEEIQHEINAKRFRISYCLNGYGLREAFIAFAIEEIEGRSENYSLPVNASAAKSKKKANSA